MYSDYDLKKIKKKKKGTIIGIFKFLYVGHYIYAKEKIIFTYNNGKFTDYKNQRIFYVNY